MSTNSHANSASSVHVDSHELALQKQEFNGVWPSVGSHRHFEGECQRCCFYPKGRCQSAEECKFCHFDHHGHQGKKQLPRRKERDDGGSSSHTSHEDEQNATSKRVSPSSERNRIDSSDAPNGASSVMTRPRGATAASSFAMTASDMDSPRFDASFLSDVDTEMVAGGPISPMRPYGSTLNVSSHPGLTAGNAIHRMSYGHPVGGIFVPMISDTQIKHSATRTNDLNGGGRVNRTEGSTLATGVANGQGSDRLTPRKKNKKGSANTGGGNYIEPVQASLEEANNEDKRKTSKQQLRRELMQERRLAREASIKRRMNAGSGNARVEGAAEPTGVQHTAPVAGEFSAVTGDKSEGKTDKAEIDGSMAPVHLNLAQHLGNCFGSEERTRKEEEETNRPRMQFFSLPRRFVRYPLLVYDEDDKEITFEEFELGPIQFDDNGRPISPPPVCPAVSQATRSPRKRRQREPQRDLREPQRDFHELQQQRMQHAQQPQVPQKSQQQLPLRQQQHQQQQPPHLQQQQLHQQQQQFHQQQLQQFQLQQQMLQQQQLLQQQMLHHQQMQQQQQNPQMFHDQHLQTHMQQPHSSMHSHTAMQLQHQQMQQQSLQQQQQQSLQQQLVPVQLLPPPPPHQGRQQQMTRFSRSHTPPEQQQQQQQQQQLQQLQRQTTPPQKGGQQRKRNVTNSSPNTAQPNKSSSTVSDMHHLYQ